MVAIMVWCAFVALVRSTGTDAHPVLIGLVGVTPLAMVPIWLVVPMAVARRTAAWIVPVVVLCIAHLAWAGSEWRFGEWLIQPAEAASGSELDVVTGNILVDNPTPELFVESLLAAEPDVILLQELTPETWLRIELVAGIEDYPHRIVDPQNTGLGSAILSRGPIRNAGVIDREITRWTTAEVQASDGVWVAIVNVHTTSPLDSLSIVRWKAELALLAERAEAADGPLILAGDFNATVHHDEFGAVLGAGMSDAHQRRGSGLGRTWSLRGVPLMGLDHVLVSDDLDVQRAWSQNGPGSDHRLLFAETVPNDS